MTVEYLIKSLEKYPLGTEVEISVNHRVERDIHLGYREVIGINGLRKIVRIREKREYDK